jgi:hypothetical protein
LRLRGSARPRNYFHSERRPKYSYLPKARTLPVPAPPAYTRMRDYSNTCQHAYALDYKRVDTYTRLHLALHATRCVYANASTTRSFATLPSAKYTLNLCIPVYLFTKTGLDRDEAQARRRRTLNVFAASGGTAKVSAHEWSGGAGCLTIGRQQFRKVERAR